jgi:hypothetical protein
MIIAAFFNTSSINVISSNLPCEFPVLASVKTCTRFRFPNFNNNVAYLQLLAFCSSAMLTSKGEAKRVKSGLLALKLRELVPELESINRIYRDTRRHKDAERPVKQMALAQMMADIVRNPDFDPTVLSSKGAGVVKLVLNCDFDCVEDSKRKLISMLLEKGACPDYVRDGETLLQLTADDNTLLRKLLNQSPFWPAAFKFISGYAAYLYKDVAAVLCEYVPHGKVDPHEVKLESVSGCATRDIIQLAQHMHQRRRTYILIVLCSLLPSEIADLILRFESHGPIPTQHKMNELLKELQ